MVTVSTNQNAGCCAACGVRLSEGARFCHACGVRAGADLPVRSGNPLAWSVAGLAVIALVGLLGGRAYGSRRSGEPHVPLGTTRAPDISSMSPEERAQRLFSRVIAYASAGREDSAAFLAPMALGAFEALAPLNAHHRFDVGLIAFAIGDMATASAQADTIIAGEPTNLLGLALAMQSADVGGDAPRRDAFARRLVAAETTELNRKLPEYIKHETELRAAIDAAKGQRS